VKVRIVPQAHHVGAQEVSQVSCYYAPSIYFDEAYIAKKVKELAKKTISVDEDRVHRWTQRFCEKKGIALSEEQQQAIGSRAVYSPASDGCPGPLLSILEWSL
jgi:hypothetical protein